MAMRLLSPAPKRSHNPPVLTPLQSPARFPEGFEFRAVTAEDAGAVRALFAQTQWEYGFDYDFSGRESDMVDLPGLYAEPGQFLGVLWDTENDTLAGTVGIRKPDTEHTTLEADSGTVELCRVYAYPEYRGQGLGKAMVQAMIQRARSLGYQRMVLESHTKMRDAIGLYEKLGFTEIPPYTPDDPEYSDYAAELSLS